MLRWDCGRLSGDRKGFARPERDETGRLGAAGRLDGVLLGVSDTLLAVSPWLGPAWDHGDEVDRDLEEDDEFILNRSRCALSEGGRAESLLSARQARCDPRDEV